MPDHTPSIVDIFNETAKAAAHDFPQTRSLLIGTMHHNIYVSPAAAEILTQHKKETDHILTMARQHMRKTQASGIAFTLNPGVTLEEQSAVTSILIDIEGEISSLAIRGFVSCKHAAAIDLISTLDHEIGHHVVEGGMNASNTHGSECAADAYTALRHIQRYGDTTDFFDYTAHTRARVIAHGTSRAHYTATVIQKINTLRHEVDITALSPLETAILACDLARKYQLNHLELRAVDEAFKPLRDWIADKKMSRADSASVTPETHIGYFDCVAEIMLAHRNDHTVWRAGKLLLSVHMSALETTRKQMLDSIAKIEKEDDIILDLAKAKDADMALWHRGTTNSGKINPPRI